MDILTAHDLIGLDTCLWIYHFELNLMALTPPHQKSATSKQKKFNKSLNMVNLVIWDKT
jgi:hypothetical protein